jgi:Protein of unknown function (DUF4241)
MTELHAVYTALRSNHPQVAAAGSLVVATGYIVACDPVLNPDRPAFAQLAPQGQFPVRLLLNDDDATLAAAVVFAPGTPHTWVLALLPGQDPAALQPNGFYGYPLNDEYGCFMDEAAFAQLERREEREIARVGEDDYQAYFDDVMDTEMAEQHDFRLLNHHPMPDSDLNVVLFQCGAGPGVYASYWGLDAQGQVLCLLTNFGLGASAIVPTGPNTSPATDLLAAVLEEDDEIDDDEIDDESDEPDDDEPDDDEPDDDEPDDDEPDDDDDLEDFDDDDDESDDETDDPKPDVKRAFDDEDVYGGDDLDRL